MLDCTVNGQTHEIIPCDEEGLGSVIRNLSSEVAKNGQYIASLKVNGEELDMNSGKYADWTLADVGRLEVSTGSTEHSALEVLTEGCAFLGELRLFLLQSAEFYRAGDETKGREFFIELIKGMEGFVKIASAVDRRLKIDFAETSCSGRTLAESVNSLNGLLLEIIVAQEQRDWILLTDLLEYELAPQLEHWLEIFTMLRSRDAENFGENLRL